MADKAAAEGRPAPEDDVPDAEWSVVSINGEMQESESPIPPETQLRNAKGKEHGGSGVPLNQAEYDRAVKYWSAYAVCQ